MSSRKSNKDVQLTAEMQNAKMSEERAFLTNLMESALAGKGPVVQRLLLEYSIEHQIPTHQVLSQFKDGSKRTALHFACQSAVPIPDTSKDEDSNNSDTDIVILLLTKSKFPTLAVESLIRLKDKDGLTPLMLACQNSYLISPQQAYQRIECLVRLGGSKVTLARSHSGGTPLHYAAAAGASKEIIELLYQNGKVALQTSSLQGGTPLHWASSVPPPKDYTHTILALLDDCNADVNAPNEQNISPLIVAAAAGNDVHAKILVQRGADRGTIFGGNLTVFHIAADLNLVGTLAALIDADKDCTDPDNSISAKCLQMKNDKGETPLDLAVLEGHLPCVMLLTGENDEEAAKSFMLEAQNKLTLSQKNNDTNQSLSEQTNNMTLNTGNDDSAQDHLSNNANIIQDETAAQQAASKLLSNHPTISEQQIKQANEYKEKGNKFFSQKQYDDAITNYTAAIQLNPVDATFYSNRSASYMGLQKYNEALYDAVMARTLKPDWSKACYRMAVARMALDRYEDAAVSAWEGLQMDQSNDELKTLLQKCVRKGRKDHFNKS
jgi:ankyrin repeat protein